MKKSKRLCLVDNPSFYPDINIADIRPIYSPGNIFQRAIRHLHHKFKFLPFSKSIWLGNWRKEIAAYDKIIIFDTIFDYTPLDFILRNNPNCKIYFCFRNRIDSIKKHALKHIDVNLLKNKYHAMVFSYNSEDCYNHDLTFYHQFHTIPNPESLQKDVVNNDVYFAGRDKGRMVFLKKLAQFFTDNDINYKFDIIPDAGVKYDSADKALLTSTIAYDEIISKCAKSKCILDLVGQSNKGITYRVLEAVVLKRKLISNFPALKDSNIYNPQNMYILGHDDRNLIEFINQPIADYEVNPENYSFNNFCKVIFSTETKA